MYNFSTNPKLKGRDFITRKMSQEEANDLFQDMTARVKCMMAVVNSAAYITMMDAIDKVKKKPIYKGKIKQLFNAAITSYNKHERDLKWGNFQGIEFFGPRKRTEDELMRGIEQATRDDLYDWYLDIGACAYKRTNNEIEGMRKAILEVLDKNNIDDKDDLSYILIADTMLEYSCSIYDQLMKEFKAMSQVDLSDAFRPFRLTSTYRYYDDAIGIITKAAIKGHGRINLNEEETIMEAFRILDTKMIEDLNNMDSADEAISENLKMLSPEVYAQYRDLRDAPH